MSQETGEAQEPQPTTATRSRTTQPALRAMTGPPQRPFPAQMPGPAPASAAERARLAARRRDESDDIFSYGSALGRTILTLGIYRFYVLYQLVRRMRDHNARRLELLDGGDRRRVGAGRAPGP